MLFQRKKPDGARVVKSQGQQSSGPSALACPQSAAASLLGFEPRRSPHCSGGIQSCAGADWAREGALCRALFPADRHLHRFRP